MNYSYLSHSRLFIKTSITLFHIQQQLHCDCTQNHILIAETGCYCWQAWNSPRFNTCSAPPTHRRVAFTNLLCNRSSLAQFCQAQIGYTSVCDTKTSCLCPRPNKSRAEASSWTGSSSSECPGWPRGSKGRCASGPTISPEPRCCGPAAWIYSGNALLVSTWNHRRITTECFQLTRFITHVWAH